jgi:D-alanyl-D-alanine-carboxypeptidase/D-alanyl-D-alanine-endopeptidase
LVQRGEVALDDPVTKFLPAAVKMPSWGGRQITLIDLSKMGATT